MAIDSTMAAASIGTYPDPDDSPTDAERAYFFASLGLLGDLPAPAEPTTVSKGLRLLGTNLSEQ